MQLKCKNIHEDGKYQFQVGGCLWGEKEVNGVGSNYGTRLSFGKAGW